MGWCARRVVLTVLLLGLGMPAAASATTPPPSTWSQIATIVSPTPIHPAGCDGPATGMVGTRAVFGAGLMRLRVIRSATLVAEDGTTSECLLVMSPERSGPRTFWIGDDRVVLGRTAWRVTIDLSSRTLTVRRAGVAVGSWSVVVGAPATPTPKGSFAVQGMTHPGASLVGPDIIAFAYSNVLDQFDGGPGRVAMHGRSGALLADPLGSARSHGCVRMDNDRIAWLAARLVNGTPIDVVA